MKCNNCWVCLTLYTSQLRSKFKGCQTLNSFTYMPSPSRWEFFFMLKSVLVFVCHSVKALFIQEGLEKGGFFCDLTWWVVQHDHISCHSSFLEEDKPYLLSRKASNARWCPKERLFSSNKWLLHISHVLEFPVSNSKKKIMDFLVKILAISWATRKNMETLLTACPKLS